MHDFNRLVRLNLLGKPLKRFGAFPSLCTLACMNQSQSNAQLPEIEPSIA
jgi:hypothetical protein